MKLALVLVILMVASIALCAKKDKKGPVQGLDRANAIKARTEWFKRQMKAQGLTGTLAQAILNSHQLTRVFGQDYDENGVEGNGLKFDAADALFSQRLLLQNQLNQFRPAYNSLVNGKDEVATCVNRYFNYDGRSRTNPGFNCGEDIGGAICGGRGSKIVIRGLTWLGNLGVKYGDILPWMTTNSPAGMYASISSSATGRGGIGGSLNKNDVHKRGYDKKGQEQLIKGHFVLEGIPSG